MTNPTLIDQARLREALERLQRHFNEKGLHKSRLDLPRGTQIADVAFARQALTETAASPGSGDGE